MRFTSRDFHEDPKFDPTISGYTQLKEPLNLNQASRIIVPVFIVNLALVQILAWVVGFDFATAFTMYGLLLCLLAIVIIAFLHEFVHTLFYPGGPFSERVVYCISKRNMVISASYLDDIPRWRMLLMLQAPFLIITMVCIVMLYFFNDARLWFFIASINAIASCVDTMIFLIILNNAPHGSLLRTQGANIFWHMGEAKISRQSEPA